MQKVRLFVLFVHYLTKHTRKLIIIWLFGMFSFGYLVIAEAPPDFAPDATGTGQ